MSNFSMRIIKIKDFWIGSDSANREFQQWQENNPKVKILDTKIVTLKQIENKMLVIYEEVE